MTTWPVAANTFIWHSPLTTEVLERRLPLLAEWGFDAVELPLENLGDWDPVRCATLLKDLGLTSLIGLVFGPGRELAAAPIATQLATKRYMRAAIELASAHNAPLVIGPAYCSVGRTWRTSISERTELLTELRENYKELIDIAGQHDVKIALEPLNRYETSVFNTAYQLMEFIDDLDAKVIGINLDTYHMNIEEQSIGDAIRLAGDRLLHLQVCGNDRGTPGPDHTPWEEVFSALRDIRYGGMLGIESFMPENASIARAASIWRPLASSQDALARDGLDFLRTFHREEPAR